MTEQKKKTLKTIPAWALVIGVLVVNAAGYKLLNQTEPEGLRIANLNDTAGEWEQVPYHTTPSTAELLGLTAPVEDTEE